MDPETLNELIARSRQHDGNAFRRLVEQHQAMVYSLAFRLLGDKEEARDAVQETFVKVWLNLPGFDVSRKFSTWVYAIATNHCHDRLRASRQRLQKVSLDELAGAVSSDDVLRKLMDRELGGLIASLTEELTPKQKIVFTLSDLEDLDVGEIREITGMTASQVKSNLYLARQMLRKRMTVFLNE